MSRTALILGLALLAAACGDKQPDTLNDSAADADAILTSENVVTGDVTAIDAAVADDSNMAADMPPPGDDLGNDGAAPAGERKGAPDRRRSGPAPAPAPADDAEPAAEEPSGNEA